MQYNFSKLGLDVHVTDNHPVSPQLTKATENTICFYQEISGGWVRSCWPEKTSLLHDLCHAQALNTLYDIFFFAGLFFSWSSSPAKGHARCGTHPCPKKPTGGEHRVSRTG